METRLTSLIWLRWQYLLSNKVVLFVCVLTPVLDVYLLNAMPLLQGTSHILSLGLGMVYSLTAGTFVSMMIGEEKEKKNLRTLILTGVNGRDYILSVTFFPLLFSILFCILIPLIFGINIYSWGIYLLIVTMTSLAFTLINLVIGFWSKNQMQSTAITLIFFFIAIFLPTLSADFTFISQITKWTFMGANTFYFNNIDSYRLTDTTMLSLVIWIVVLLFLLRWAFKWNQKEHG